MYTEVTSRDILKYFVWPHLGNELFVLNYYTNPLDDVFTRIVTSCIHLRGTWCYRCTYLSNQYPISCPLCLYCDWS